MAKRGQRAYLCRDCGNRVFLWRHDFSRASRPHCPACGCTALEADSKGAKKQIVEQQRLVVDPPPILNRVRQSREPQKHKIR